MKGQQAAPGSEEFQDGAMLQTMARGSQRTPVTDTGGHGKDEKRWRVFMKLHKVDVALGRNQE